MADILTLERACLGQEECVEFLDLVRLMVLQDMPGGIVGAADAAGRVPAAVSAEQSVVNLELIFERFDERLSAVEPLTVPAQIEFLRFFRRHKSRKYYNML